MDERRSQIESHPGITDIQYIESCIAIDGPTASGKSVIGRQLSHYLEIPFCDTGLMYRAATLSVLQAEISPDDSLHVIELLENLDLDLHWDTPDAPIILLDSISVNDQLRNPEIENMVSLIAKLPEVRSMLVARQRFVASREAVIMVGRDIGRVVLPEAKTKIFLDASIEIRARRRYAEQIEAGRDMTMQQSDPSQSDLQLDRAKSKPDGGNTKES
ncbi:MAG TPA: (d)CMP kinase [Dehalococcoidia bacterium]|nr:(d)CMP kinase [Dehalococcoidia bacterium]